MTKNANPRSSQLASDRLRGESQRNNHRGAGQDFEAVRDSLANELYPEDTERRNAFTEGWNNPHG
jgi:hypothetical protein